MGFPNFTRFVSNRPDKQINAGGVRHHVHLVLVDSVQVLVASVTLVVVLLVLQLRLADQEQLLDELLHVFRERRRQIWKETLFRGDSFKIIIRLK